MQLSPSATPEPAAEIGLETHARKSFHPRPPAFPFLQNLSSVFGWEEGIRDMGLRGIECRPSLQPSLSWDKEVNLPQALSPNCIPKSRYITWVPTGSGSQGWACK